MSDSNKTKNPFYFSTRDLLIMAVLAALGGVTSTYINTLSDAVQAALGFAGASQWTAGLHVLWIVLAMGILRKLGVGTLTGILKGVVELMSGNSHGVIILLVDLAAGLLVDFGFFVFNKKQSLLAYMLAGGLATASNVLVFQIFATLPQNILGLTAILILFVIALASGIVFAGILSYLLVNALTRAGVVKLPEKPMKRRKLGWWVLLSILVITLSLSLFLRVTLQGPQVIQISGAVEEEYQFPNNVLAVDLITREMEYRGVMTQYQGYPLKQIIDNANPNPDADTLLVEAADGYAFFISFAEINLNDNILLVKQVQGGKASFDIVGPESSKAWVRNVTKLSVIQAQGLSITTPNRESFSFKPEKWVSDMDSTQIALPEGSQKLQGVPVWKVIESVSTDIKQPLGVMFRSEKESLNMDWSELDKNDDLRIFTIIEGNSIDYALAEMSGQVRIYPLKEIVIE